MVANPTADAARCGRRPVGGVTKKHLRGRRVLRVRDCIRWRVHFVRYDLTHIEESAHKSLAQNDESSSGFAVRFKWIRTQQQSVNDYAKTRKIVRFRQALGEAGVEELLATTIAAAMQVKAIEPAELERVIVDSTVQEKAIAYPTDSRLLEVVRTKLVRLAQGAGQALKQTYAREGKRLRRRAGGYAHAQQFKRLRRVLKRQRAVLGRVLRDIERQMSDLSHERQTSLRVWLERAWRICRQRPKDKDKLYALHAPEVECIGKGKARQTYEFGVKVSLVMPSTSLSLLTARRWLIADRLGSNARTERADRHGPRPPSSFPALLTRKHPALGQIRIKRPHPELPRLDLRR